MAKNYNVSSKIEERKATGREAELSDDLETAVKAFEENIREIYGDAYSFDRLLIIYRKQKKFRDELRVINKGIKLFTDLHANQLKHNKSKKQVAALSNAFMVKSGLTDKKGNHLFTPEPVNKWLKRKAIVEKKLAANKKAR